MPGVSSKSTNYINVRVYDHRKKNPFFKMKDTKDIAGNVLVLIHGIGEQKKGDTLLNFCKNLYNYYYSKDIVKTFIKGFFFNNKIQEESEYSLVFYFNHNDLADAFKQWIDCNFYKSPVKKFKYEVSRISKRRTMEEKEGSSKKWYYYVDIQIKKKRNHETAEATIFRVYEVFWADSFKAPDILYVFSMLGTSIITLFKKLDIQKPFLFLTCLMVNIGYTLAFIPFMAFLMIFYLFYMFDSLLHMFSKRKNFFILYLIRRMFERWVGDVSIYIEKPTEAKNIRKPLQDFLANFNGFRWDDYHRKFIKIKRHDDFRFKPKGVQSRGKSFKYISILAHSFGSVVSFEVLSKIHKNKIGKFLTRKIKVFFTTGSPLERIRYFWGHYKTRFGYELTGALKSNWYNFWDIADPISSRVKNFDPNPSNMVCFNRLGAIFLFPFSHNQYLKNSMIMSQILEKSFGPDFKFLNIKGSSEKGCAEFFKFFKNFFKTIYTAFFYFVLIFFLLWVSYLILLSLLIKPFFI